LADFLPVHDIPRPPTVLVRTGSKQEYESLSRLTFPVLAKPPLEAGGYGIRRFENCAELSRFLAGKDDGDIWVVQEFVEGHDVCVNVLCENGKVIAATTQHAFNQPPSSYKPPYNFEFKCDSSALDIASRLMAKLGWSGIANVDMRFDEKRNAVVVLEVNGRYWASLLGSVHAGVNFPLLACKAVLGQISSSIIPQNTRYFRGTSNALLSLIGGGKFRVKPAETDLAYLFRDPIRLAWLLATTATASVRDRLSNLHSHEQRVHGQVKQ